MVPLSMAISVIQTAERCMLSLHFAKNEFVGTKISQDVTELQRVTATLRAM